MKTDKFGAFTRKLGTAGVVVAVAILAPELAFGITNNCGTNPAGEEAMTTINAQSNGLSGAVSSSGCGSVDEAFSNFVLSGFESNTTGNTDAYSTANAFPEGQTLTTTLANDVPTATGDTSTNTGNLVYLAQFGTSSVATNSQIKDVVVNISDIDLPGFYDHFGTDYDASIDLTVYVCENATAAPAAAFTTCATGTLATQTLTLTNTTATASSGLTLSVTVPLGVTISDAAIDVDITSISNHDGAASFTGLSIETEAPEPASIVLVGSSLLFLGFLRLRRKSA